MKESSKGPERQSTTSLNKILRRVTQQQTQSAPGMATRTRSQSQTHMIHIRYLNDTRNPIT